MTFHAEIDTLRATIGQRIDWSRRKALPRGYTATVSGSPVAMTRVSDIAQAARLTSLQGRDVAITLCLGVDTLGTVSADRYSYAYASAPVIDPEGYIPRALLAHLWTTAHGRHR
jgi:hypothetical protein